MHASGQIFTLLLLASSALDVSVVGDDQDTENPSVWEYEPRIWSPDETINSSDDFHAQSCETEANSDSFLIDNDFTRPIESFSRHSNFLKPNIKLKQQAEEECTQFRVDTREAVVCDKSRCDKFDFEWPQYDNQIAMVETTRHGMRFHRADFAFATKSTRKGLDKRPDEKVKDIKVPFDIFDLFKPKPSSTTTTSTTTTPATTTTIASSSTTPASTTDTSSPNATTTTKPPVTTSAINDNSQDGNTTQLVSTFRLDTRRRKQNMVGFGGALSDSTCRNIKSLSPQMTKSLMEDYYGDRGLKYNIARLTIGSSDFSVTPYTNNDQTSRQSVTDGGMGDVEMKNFHLTDEDYEFKLPVARQAIATSKQEMKFFASLWSPPIWMKNNSHIVHGYLKGDVYGPFYKGLAELMIKWLEAYRKNGIELWAMTGLNEPVTGIKPMIFHNSLGITREDYVTFFKLYLGPMLRQRGFQNVKLMMLDDNKGYVPNWVNAMLEDQEAAKYISGIAIHWYMNDEYENLNFLPNKYPDKFILSTEACNGYLPFQVHALPGNWDRGVAYMYDIIKTIQKNSAGWVDWNMALDLSGGPSWAKNYLDAAIIVNAARDEYYKSPMFYALGHFSRFVESNSTRLDYRIANAKYDYPLEAVGFHTPRDYIVIVALNANKNPVPFKIIVDRQLVRILTLRAESFSTIVFKWKAQA